MGSTHWSNNDYKERANRRAAAGRDAFEHDEDIRQGAVAAAVHQRMNPYGVQVRESRDSESHPESRAVAVLFDVTGSMQNVPRILQASLPRLMDLLIESGYLEHPQILIGGIGDATCDTAPFQVGQFESGIEIEEDLSRLYLEGGGGGQLTESYELALHFMARHTALDCLEKRGQRGYLFVIGDEMPYSAVKRREVEHLIGEKIQADIPTEEMLDRLREMYDVYFIIPRLTSYWNNTSIYRHWVKLLGQNVLKLENPAGICELIAATIGLAEGKIELGELSDDLAGAGATDDVAQAVGLALAKASTDTGPSPVRRPRRTTRRS